MPADVAPRRPPRAGWIPACLAALGAALAPQARAEVEEHYEETFYVVNARPDMPLSVLINQASYLKTDGVTYHGRATPNFRSTLFYVVDASTGLCRLSRVLVKLRIEVRYPRLFDATDAQRASYDRFMASLRVHEQGHVDRYRATAAQMVRDLEALPPMPDCDAVRTAAFDRGDAILREGREANARYDAVTDHGLNQGAN